MHHATPKSRRSAGERALLSHSTILILSGYLIGLGTAPGISAGAGWGIIGAGLCGIAAYAALRVAAQRQGRRAAAAAIRRAIRELEIRIDRHIPRHARHRRLGAARRPVVSARSYVTVVRKPGIR